MVKTFKQNRTKYKHCHLQHKCDESYSLTISAYLPEEHAVDGEVILYAHDDVLREWEIVLAGGQVHAVLEEV